MNKKEKIIPFIMVIIVMIILIISFFSSPKTYAATTEDGMFEYLASSDSVMITKCNKGGKIEIPNIIDNKPVTSISTEAFDKCYWITSITIPSNLSKSLSGRLFRDCSSLTDIYVDEENAQYKSVDGVLFNKDMSYLIKYPQAKQSETYNIPTKVLYISDYCFFGMHNLKTMDIPEGVKTISPYTFASSSIETIKMPETITSIEEHAFWGCELEKVTIPESVTQIGNGAFKSCKFTKIEIPENVKNIGSCAFSDNRELQEIIVDNSNKNYSSKDGVLYDKNMNTLICYPTMKQGNSFKIIDTVETIETYAFAYCEKINTINFSNSVTKIQDKAFVCCTNLTNFELPENLTYLGTSAFKNCGVIEITIPGSISVIRYNAFSECGNLENVTIESGVSTIQYYAFDKCPKLKSIIIPRSVNTIEGIPTTIDTLTIYGWEKSKAQEFANENNIKFELLVDTKSPTLKISSNGGVYKKASIYIYVDDNESLLDTNNQYEYQLSLSNTSIPSGEWITYSSLKNFVIGDNLNGDYYLWVKSIKDRAGNKSEETVPGYLVSDKFTFDNIKPSVMITTDKEEYKVGETATITATFDENIKEDTSRIIFGNYTWDNLNNDDAVQILQNTYKMVKKTDKMYTYDYKVPNQVGTQEVTIVGATDIVGNIMEKTSKTINIISTLDNIQITVPPTKINYIADQNFESEGMKVTANYSDGTSKEIKNYVILDGDKLSTDKTSVTISYTENGITKTTTQSIMVIDKLKISFDAYDKVDKDKNQYINNIAPNTTIEDMISNVKTNGKIIIYKENKEITNNKIKISTGMKVKISLNDETDEFIAVVKGDTNGDGESNLKDILQINKHRLNKTLLTGEYLLAGDVNKDKEVNLKDLLKINKFRLGKIATL